MESHLGAHPKLKIFCARRLSSALLCNTLHTSLSFVTRASLVQCPRRPAPDPPGRLSGPLSGPLPASPDPRGEPFGPLSGRLTDPLAGSFRTLTGELRTLSPELSGASRTLTRTLTGALWTHSRVLFRTLTKLCAETRGKTFRRVPESCAESLRKCAESSSDSLNFVRGPVS